ncbi:MAG: ABC transporter substrate-binding protein [Bdellovibrionaceae bacterium]|nr:ABC transporter substrate-binding protein [Pseudobdellovibrionaceae bacterium]
MILKMIKSMTFVFLFVIQTYAQESKPISLALNWVPEPQFGGFYQAQFHGIFKKNTLNVEILKGGSGTPTIQMLSKGVVDFAIVSAEEILISNDKNAKNQIVALFATFQTNPQMLMSHKSRGLKSIADILQNDGYLAWQSGLSYSLFLRKKYPQSKVKMVPYLGGLTQFQKDQQLSQQGFITSEPIAAEKLGVKVSSYLVADEGFNPYTTVLAVRKDFLKNNKELTEKMLKSVREGWEQYLLDFQSTNQKMHELNTSMDLETFNLSAKAQVNLIKTDKGVGSMTLQRWQELIQQMKTLALIKRNLKAEDQFLP